ncbi:uncharacterized protein LOC102365353 [Latimeria chalumnae]|uniref:uncharacterized protein LOC102365353 n=1 Tax=Latimeria chalumnae TaxID=7897 RepID=UPI0003C1AC0D
MNSKVEDKAGFGPYYCAVCEAPCSSEKTLKIHELGNKHKKKLALLKNEVGREKTAPSETATCSTTSAAPVTNLDILINDPRRKEPVIGLPYLIEYRLADRHPRYECTLCKVRTEANSMFEHLSGLKHKRSYISEAYPHMLRGNYSAKFPKKSVINKNAALIEKMEGIKKIRVIFIKSLADVPLMPRADISRVKREMERQSFTGNMTRNSGDGAGQTSSEGLGLLGPVSRKKKALEYMENFQIASDEEAIVVLNITQDLTESLKEYCQLAKKDVPDLNQSSLEIFKEFAVSTNMQGVVQGKPASDLPSLMDCNPYGSLQASLQSEEGLSTSFYGNTALTPGLNPSAVSGLFSLERRDDSAVGSDGLHPISGPQADCQPFLSSYSEGKSNLSSAYLPDYELIGRPPSSYKDISVNSDVDLRQPVSSSMPLSSESMPCSSGDIGGNQLSMLLSMLESTAKESFPSTYSDSSALPPSQKDFSTDYQSLYDTASPYYRNRASGSAPTMNARPPSPVRVDLDRERDLLYQNDARLNLERERDLLYQKDIRVDLNRERDLLYQKDGRVDLDRERDLLYQNDMRVNRERDHFYQNDGRVDLDRGRDSFYQNDGRVDLDRGRGSFYQNDGRMDLDRGRDSRYQNDGRIDLDRGRDSRYQNEGVSSSYQSRPPNIDLLRDFLPNISGLTPEVLHSLRGKDMRTVTAILTRITRNNPAMQKVDIPTLIQMLMETGALG